MRGNKKKHKEMWQFIIDRVDNIFNDYIEGYVPECVLIDYKLKYIESVDPDKDIMYNCYACEKFANVGCSECAVGKRIGSCAHRDSAFQKLLNALVEQDKNEFIKQAEVIRDAWK